jgi:hypothetical protein
MREAVRVTNWEDVGKGLGLVAFGLLWAITGNVVSSALVGFGIYLIVKSLGGEERGSG